MEDQTSWKGHTFTLLVFTGIVVLSSIFFVLGMLVGRAQAQKIASTAPAAETAKVNADAKPEPKADKPNFTFDSVKKEQLTAVLEPPPKPDPPVVQEHQREVKAEPKTEFKAKADPPAPALPPVTSKPTENTLHYQIGALRKSADAERLLEGVKKKGFRAFILSPSNDSDPYYRVQVGPFSDPIQAQEMKKKLENAGYQPMLKK